MVCHFLLVSIFSVVAGQICQNLNISTSELVSVTIQVTTKDGQNVYEIVAGKNSPMEVFLLLVNSTSCPRECTSDLLSYISPKNDSVLHVQGQPLLVPIGYNMAESRRLSCAVHPGSCGANVPLYRHYKFQLAGILHAYSFDLEPIAGYMREWLPMCYGWTAPGNIQPAVTPANHPTSPHLP